MILDTPKNMKCHDILFLFIETIAVKLFRNTFEYLSALVVILFICVAPTGHVLS